MSDRHVFVTGAAAGIGRAIATRFARGGAFVGVYDIDVDGAAQVRDELGQSAVLSGSIDVRDPASWQRALVEFTTATGGRVDVLVNNAGVLSGGPFEQIPLEVHMGIVRVNVDGVLIGCHAAFPYLSRTPGATVINVGSASALYGQPELASYSGSKFAVRGLTEALNIEWRRHGITVRDVLPSYVQTDMARGFAHLGSAQPIGINLTADAVADAVWAASTDGRDAPPHVLLDWRTRAAAFGHRILPPRLARWIVGRVAGIR